MTLNQLINLRNQLITENQSNEKEISANFAEYKRGYNNGIFDMFNEITKDIKKCQKEKPSTLLTT